MAHEVFQETETYSIEWDDDISAVVHTWKKYSSGDAFRDAASELLEHIRSENASKVLINSSGIKAHDAEDKQWLMEVWTPKLDDAGVEYAATVHADSSISRMELEKMTGNAPDLSSEMLATSDLAQARDWLSDRP